MYVNEALRVKIKQSVGGVKSLFWLLFPVRLLSSLLYVHLWQFHAVYCVAIAPLPLTILSKSARIPISVSSSF